MLSRVSSRELSEWAAYYRLEPWGEERADLRIGVLDSILANLFRKKGSREYKAQDFMLNFGKQDEAPDWRSMLSKVEMLNAAFGGVDKRGKSGS